MLQKRLKTFLRSQVLGAYKVADLPPELSMDQNPHRFEYLVVVDFEATCEEANPPDHLFEIIEFPALLFNIKDRLMVCVCARVCMCVRVRVCVCLCICMHARVMTPRLLSSPGGPVPHAL